MSAQQGDPVTVPVTGALAMEAVLPGTQLLAVALTAETVRFVKGETLAGRQPQEIPIFRVVTVETPELPGGMLEGNGAMFVLQDATPGVGLHLCMAVRTGVEVFGEIRGGN